MNKQRHIFLIVLILYLAIISLFMTAIMVVPSGLADVAKNDKIIHFVQFLVLAILLLKVLEVYGYTRVYLDGLMIGLAIMILSESLQLLVPHRTFSVYDMIANFSGFLVGMLTFRLVIPKRDKLIT